MADAKKGEAAPAEDEVPKKKSKLLLIIIVAVLVLVLGGGGAAFMLMGKKSADEEDEADGDNAQQEKVVKAKKKKKGEDHPPVFTKLEPFVVKLTSEGQESYAQALPEMKLTEAPVADKIKLYNPEIRHKLLMLMASKTPAELSTPQGMQTLANQMRVAVNAILSGQKPDPAKEKLDSDDNGPVIAVFFSSFIVQ